MTGVQAGVAWPDPRGLVEARRQWHNGAQWLARMASSYAAQASEDGEPRLFLNDGRKLITPEVTPGVTVALDLPDLVMRFEMDGAPTPHPLHLDDTSSAAVEAWLLIEMLHRDIERAAFSKELPYSFDHMMSGDEAKYAAVELSRDLAALATLVAAAARALTAARGGGAESLSCWPRTMEIGYVALGGRVGFDLDAGFVVHASSTSPRLVVPLDRLAGMTIDDVAAALADAAR